MTFTTIRIVIALLGIGGLGLWLWNIHDSLADARVRNALAQAQEQKVDERKREVEWLNRERDIERNDTEVVEKARESVAVLDWADCPDVPAEYFRLLDSIGEELSAEPPSGEVSDPGT